MPSVTTLLLNGNIRRNNAVGEMGNGPLSITLTKFNVTRIFFLQNLKQTIKTEI